MSDSKIAQDFNLSTSRVTAPMTQTPSLSGRTRVSASVADLASKSPARHAELSFQSLETPSSLHGVVHEQALVSQGKLLGLDNDAKADTPMRKPGQEDEAGNKIYYKSVLGHILHWEHTGMNSDE